MKIWLIFDATYVAYRALHSTGALTFDGDATGVLYGFLRDIETQTELHGATNFVFAFDYGGPGLRAEIDPNYKFSRYNKELTEEELQIQKSFREQIFRLKYTILPEMGFRNIFFEKGFEADDIIALIAEDIPYEDEAVIISADEDLWQCISSNVKCYNPRSGNTVNIQSFKKKWHIDPSMWSFVKAMAGCVSDDVKGIEGIGNISAAKWYANELKEGSKKHETILDNLSIVNKNMSLVRLPFPGLELPDLREDEYTVQKKTEVEIKLGIRPKRLAKKRRVRTGGFDI